MSYAAELLSRVADLTRSLGTRIILAPLIASRRLSGTIVLDRSGSAQLTRLARVQQVEVRADAAGWTMVKVGGAIGTARLRSACAP